MRVTGRGGGYFRFIEYMRRNRRTTDTGLSEGERGGGGTHMQKNSPEPQKKGSKKALGNGGGGTHMQKKYGISSFY